MKKIMLIMFILVSISLFADNKGENKKESKQESSKSQFKGLSDNNTGRIGVGLGGYNYISGVTGKFYLTDKLAAQALLGFMYHNGFAVGVDGIFEFLNPLKGNKDILLPIYAGAGVNGWFWDGGSIFSIAGIFGVALQFKAFPIELTAEIRPSFFFGDAWYGSNKFHIQGGGSVRFFF